VTALVEPDSDVMQHELSAIKTMVGQVLRRQTEVGPARPAVPPDMPQQLFDLYLELIGQDLSEELADRIVKAVRGELHQEQWDDPELVREALVRHLAELVPAADGTVPQRSPDDRPLTIALIGPTGVGKTTTLAKLAASFKLRQHRRVGLVTCDTYRIAAVDQLRTYANIIGLPLEIALTPAEMRQAVHALRDCDVVLIDTAGRAPNDRGRLDELHTCLAAVDPHEVHLVLSSTSSQRVLMREAEAFAMLGADRVVLTKLDEAVSFGVLINVMQAVGKKLSFVTTGQEVPDHLEIGRPRRLAELVLGAPLHS
jgi:flagellar biosynthesis protein FlhF